MADIDTIERVIRQAAEDDAAWPDMLVRLADFLGGVEATLGGGAMGEAPHMLAPRTDPHFVARYFTDYHAGNALMRDMYGATPGRVVIDETLDNYAHFQRSSFYNEWCLPQRFQHAFGVTISTSTGWHGALMVNTSSAIDPEQVRRFEAIAPLLSRTIEINKVFAGFRDLARSSLDVLELSGQAAILLDRAGALLDCNASANALFEDGRLRLRGQRLSADDEASARHLTQLIALAISAPDHTGGGRMQLVTPQGPLGVHCVPYPGGLMFPAARRPAVIVIITDPHRKLQKRLAGLQQRFGLTSAEVELALALVETGSRKAAASDRGVSDATARTQLTSIFDKTGVRRQTDLVRLLLEER